MILNLSSFSINSYFCKKQNGSTSQIEYFFDIPQSYIDETTHMSVTYLSIPNTWYQLSNSDSITLIEGFQKIELFYKDGNYNSKEDLINDLQQKLTNGSPNSFTYTVTDGDIGSLIKKNNIKITCNNTSEEIQILIGDNHLRLLYGLREVNNFVNGEIISETINLAPISSLYVHCSGCVSYNNGGIDSSDIVASLNIVGGNVSDLNKLGLRTFASYELKANMKRFSRTKNMLLSITDFDNEIIDLNNNNWDIQICIFRYEEILYDKWLLYIDYELTKDHIAAKDHYGIVQSYS